MWNKCECGPPDHGAFYPPFSAGLVPDVQHDAYASMLAAKLAAEEAKEAAREAARDIDVCVNLLKYGIYSDGTHAAETTDGINDALQYYHDNGIPNVVFPYGEYLIDPSRTAKGYTWVHPTLGNRTAKGIAIRSNSTVDFGGSTIRAKGNNVFVTNVIAMFGAQNAILRNAHIIGDRDTHIQLAKITDWEAGSIDASGVDAEGDGIRSGYVTQLYDGSTIPASFYISRWVGVLNGSLQKTFTIFWYSDSTFISSASYTYGATITKPSGATRFRLYIATETYSDRQIAVVLGTDATYKTQEFGHGVAIVNSENCVLQDLEIEKCVADAICIDDNAYCNSRYLYFERVDMHDCRRQGVSVIGGGDYVFTDCKFHAINGTSPELGVDIEYDGSGKIKRPTFFDRCSFYDNNYGDVLNCNGEALTVRNSSFFYTDESETNSVTSISDSKGDHIEAIIHVDGCTIKAKTVQIRAERLQNTSITSVGQTHLHYPEYVSSCTIHAGDFRFFRIKSDWCPICVLTDTSIVSETAVAGNAMEDVVISDTSIKITAESEQTMLTLVGCKIARSQLNVRLIRNCIAEQSDFVFGSGAGGVISGEFRSCTFKFDASAMIGYDAKTIFAENCTAELYNAPSTIIIPTFGASKVGDRLTFINCKLYIKSASAGFSFNTSLPVFIRDCYVKNESDQRLTVDRKLGGWGYNAKNESRNQVKGLVVESENLNVPVNNVQIYMENTLFNGVEPVFDLGANLAVKAGDCIGGRLVTGTGIMCDTAFVADTEYSANACFVYNNYVYQTSAKVTIPDTFVFPTPPTVGAEVTSGVWCVGKQATYTTL